MNTLICGALAVAGCVVLSGAGIADTSNARDDEKKREGAAVPAHARTLPPSRVGMWSMELHANPHVGKEETKDLLKGKRPQ